GYARRGGAAGAALRRAHPRSAARARLLGGGDRPPRRRRRNSPGARRVTVYDFDGRRPRIDPSAFIAPGAAVIGDVELGPDASVWHGAVLRGDDGPIRIGPRSNVQDMTVIHVFAPTVIGANVTIGHRAVLHGVTVEDDAMIGIGAILLDGVHVEK